MYSLRGGVLPGQQKREPNRNRTMMVSATSSSVSLLANAAVYQTLHLSSSSASLIISQPIAYRRRRRSSIGIIKLRGGGSASFTNNEDGLSESTSTTTTTKKKGKSGKRKTKSTSSSGSGGSDGIDVHTATEITTTKDAIDGVLRGKDAATALGDAIRNRADELRRDVILDTRSYSERAFDTAVISVGLSLGTAGTDVDNTYVNDGKIDSVMAYYRHGHRNNNDNGINHSRRPGSKEDRYDEEEEEIQQQRPSVLISEYFVMTHGGTHIAQCLFSLLASVLGVSCLLLPSFPSHGLGTTIGSNKDAKAFSKHILLSTTKCQLLQQTLLVAMAKHASGIVGAINLGAHQIPRAGVRDARRRIELVASDPVGQYLFYCSLLAVWIGWFGGGNGSGRMGDYVAELKGNAVSIMNAAAITTTTTADYSTTTTAPTVQLLDALSQHPPPWFLCQSPYGVGHIVPFLVLGPILLREVISVVWVCSDVLTLLSVSTSGMTGAILSRVLTTSNAAMDIFMSTLISRADSFQRQRTLSLLVSRISLLMELAMGVVLLVDAAVSFWTYALIGPTPTTTSGKISGQYPFRSMLGKMVCAHLYINFLLSRRKKE